ncbi:winged helix DNA-binding protein [Rhodobacterales bacterium HKCCE4037]|nr:winged helix DNA-binding protein [Rhodobacterales bacterium HKCCE4037]
MTFDPDLLRRIHHVANREWAVAARDLGMSHSEFEYLSAVLEQEELMRFEDHHGQHLHDIVEMLGVTKPSASAMIAKLEERGLVRRFQCRMDGRAQHIVLTDEGRRLHGQGRGIYERVATKLAAMDAAPPS